LEFNDSNTQKKKLKEAKEKADKKNKKAMFGGKNKKGGKMNVMNKFKNSSVRK
jgi:hypothetical protein